MLAASPPLPPGLEKTRLHGHYGLSQLVVAQGDVTILGFAGDPHRPLAERRAKGLPLTDLADMLRSFDQAAWSSVFRFAESDPVAVDQLLTPALVWRDLAQAAFLGEYRTVIDGCPSWPAEAAAADQLIRLFLLHRLVPGGGPRSRPPAGLAQGPAAGHPAASGPRRSVTHSRR